MGLGQGKSTDGHTHQNSCPLQEDGLRKEGLSLLPVREISPPPLQNTEEARKDQRGPLMGSSKSHFLQMRPGKKSFPLNTSKCLFLSVMLPPTTLRTATQVFSLTYSETSRDVGYKGAWKVRQKRSGALLKVTQQVGDTAGTRAQVSCPTFWKISLHLDPCL